MFTVERPNGAATTQSAVTGTNGFATATLRLNRRRDPPGTYQVAADASLASRVSGRASTSFVVR